MLDIFSGLRLVVKRRSISIDNAIFRCHWFFTSTLLVSFSLVITARQYVGQPIECHSVNKIADSLLNSYCWVQSTFSVPQACNLQVGTEVPYPCIDNTRGREIKMFAYYQWVGMVLFIQGLMFHLPYYLWKVWENGLIKAITCGLRVAVISDQERNKKKDIVVEYIYDHWGCHKRYALKYFLCEFICLINLLAQLWATNKFFDGQFLRYGLDVLEYSSTSISNQFASTTTSSSQQLVKQLINNHDNNNNIINNSSSNLNHQLNRIFPNQQKLQQQQNRVDPMTYIFPRITKCTYYDFGSSGDIQKHDALCLLPLNIINEKIYIALWFWFLVLALLTLLVILYRIFAIVSENVRCKGLISRCKLSNEGDIRVICRHCDVGDWFLFYMVAENLDPLIMREIVASIANKIRAQIDLKRELGTLAEDANVRRSSIYKRRGSLISYDYDDSRSRAPTIQPNAAAAAAATANLSQSFASTDETLLIGAGSRRESFMHTSNDHSSDNMPLMKKIKKRLYSKRLWSMDLGSGELRQQLFGHQPPVNPDSRYQSTPSTPLEQLSVVPLFPLPPPPAHASSTTSSSAERAIVSSGAQLVSAPPASLMPLGSNPPIGDRQRRGSLTRMSSTSSSVSTASDTFVMEMQTVSGSSSCLASTYKPQQQQQHQRRPLLRQRNAHQHHQSITSLRELHLFEADKELV